MAEVTTDFDDFVGSRHQRWVRVGVLAGWPQQDVEDAVQAALSTLWRRWRRVSAFDNPDAYVMKVVINSLKKDATRRARRARRAAGTESRTKQSEATDDDPQEQVARSALVRAALSDLPPDQRATIVLRYFLDLSEKDTADVLGVAAGTVKSRTSRALAALAANGHLKEYQER
ncbi:sigma-70 family RNA polymerase sigma factor [Nocardioides sp. WV_118_6]|uniref:sigma-70 family RNA polymerase sigma factor n=1 Tax=Nocardioides simplex TaxID=2045 RepID=UPI00214F66A9|nr:sigma-70 family RNA polymerase sigma factor [Pimelobacter simplex]UUW91319.1 sigma-70 family RNA polymerase sigma factor [Pimelobacter simplex]UUW95147.1 sigma-70 family RNA polymerase sigma factor [Pimelobacter simplex]